MSLSFSGGNGGKITVNAFEFIDIGNDSVQHAEFSRISASALIAPEGLRQLAGLSEVPTGNAGDLNINTPKLKIDKQGEISVNNEGLGNGGNLFINASNLLVSNQGKVIANTASGQGGNINLNLNSDLILRKNSLIDTKALGKGNGGNITINSPVIAGFENSDIIANAYEGNGGNIDITTQGIFGLKFGDRLSSNSDITASSEYGVNGTVEINNIGIDPGSGLVELSIKLSDSSQQITSGCSIHSDSNFIATGKGGIPRSPNQYLISNQSWFDITDLSISGEIGNNTTETVNSNKPVIIEATGFIRNSKGEIELVASQNIPVINKQIPNCSDMNT